MGLNVRQQREIVRAACEANNTNGYVSRAQISEVTGLPIRSVGSAIAFFRKSGDRTFEILAGHQTGEPSHVKAARAINALSAKSSVVYVWDIAEFSGMPVRQAGRAVDRLRADGMLPPGVTIPKRVRAKIAPECGLCGEKCDRVISGKEFDIDDRICRSCHSELIAERAAKRAELITAEKEAERQREIEKEEHRRKRRERRLDQISAIVRARLKEASEEGWRLSVHDDDPPTYLKSKRARERENRAELCRRWFAEWQAIRETHSVCLIA